MRRRRKDNRTGWRTAAGVLSVFATVFFLGCADENGGEVEVYEGGAALTDDVSGGAESFRERSAELIEISNDLLIQDEAVMERAESEDPVIGEICGIVAKTGAFPVFDDVQADYYTSGQAALTEILDAIREAEDYVFLEYFVIEEGQLWDEISEVLTEKAKQGIEVRVMYDGWMAADKLPEDFSEKLRADGISCRIFLPPDECPDELIGSRNHRKMLIVDGNVVFSGGMNLADSYVNYTDPYGYWQDNGMKLRGGIVNTYLLMFLQDWFSAGDAEYWVNGELPEGIEEEFLAYRNGDNTDGQYRGEGYAMAYGDTPFDEVRVGEEVYRAILDHAVSYVHITTPYFTPGKEMMESLIDAAERGVDVRIILPGISEMPIMQDAAHIYYPSLLEAGVKIYEFTPGFIHQKIFVSDDARAVVGTINLDSRSLRLHLECASYFSRMGIVDDVERDFLRILTECREITGEDPKDWQIPEERRKFLERLDQLL